MFTFVNFLSSCCKTFYARFFTRFDLLAFLVVSLPFFGYFIGSKYLMGFDTYYFLAFIRFGFWHVTDPPLMAMLFFTFLRGINLFEWLFFLEFLPLKLLLWFAYLANGVVLHVLAVKFLGERPLVSPVWFLALAPYLYAFYFNLENDQFAIPFLLLSFLVFAFYQRYWFLGLISLGIGSLFWYGSIYFFPAVIASLPAYFWLLVVPVYLVPNFVSYLFQRGGFTELMSGLIYSVPFLPALFLAFRGFSLLSLVTVYFFVLAVAQLKLSIFFMLFGALVFSVLVFKYARLRRERNSIAFFCFVVAVVMLLSWFPAKGIVFQNVAAERVSVLAHEKGLKVFAEHSLGYHDAFYCGDCFAGFVEPDGMRFFGHSLYVLPWLAVPPDNCVFFEEVYPYRVYECFLME